MKFYPRQSCKLPENIEKVQNVKKIDLDNNSVLISLIDNLVSGFDLKYDD